MNCNIEHIIYVERDLLYISTHIILKIYSNHDQYILTCSWPSTRFRMYVHLYCKQEQGFPGTYMDDKGIHFDSPLQHCFVVENWIDVLMKSSSFDHSSVFC